VDLSKAAWRTSTYSGGTNCVEVAFVEGGVAVRDSKQRHGPVLIFTVAEWDAFLQGVGDGEFRPL
jgi:hypothetical protein